MTLKTRRIIFYSFLFLFIVTGLGTVFYSQGWRIVAENCQIVKLLNCSIEFQKTGAIFIETKPKGVIIKIDGKTFQDKSGLIQSGTLITNLSPKSYVVKIKKDGYLSWQKNLRVEPALVTEILNIILVPSPVKKDLISIPKPVNDFWLSDQQKIVFKTNESLYYWSNSPLSKLKGDEVIDWDKNNNKIVLKDSKGQNYYLYDLNNLSKTLNLSVLFGNLKKGEVINEVKFHPFDANKLIIKNKNSLYLLDPVRLNSETVTEESLLAWTVKNPNIYYIKETKNLKLKTENYHLAFFNLILKTENLLAELPNQLINPAASGLKIEVAGNKIAILADNGGLYIFNQKNRDLKQIAHSAKKFIFSPDRKKIAFLDENRQLNIYFLEEFKGGINKKEGDVISLNIYKDNAALIVNDIFWYKDSYHLFVDYIAPAGSASIDFIEIDDRPPINKYSLFEGVSNFYYEPISNRLYFTQENNLYFVEF